MAQPSSQSTRAPFEAIAMTSRPLCLLLAGLACGHAIGQDLGNQESVSLRGVATRTIAEERATLEPRLRLYVDARPGLRFDGRSALPERAPRIGIEFTLAPRPAPSLALGTLLHTKLSESTHLSLRVRHDGFGVMLRSEF